MHLEERVEYILNAIGLKHPARVETILALSDEDTPSGFHFLKDRGLPISSGATTRQLLDHIAPRLGKSHMDRELRDFFFLPLREVGILIRGYADSKEGAVRPHYWKPKSPNNVYVLNPEFRDLLSSPTKGFRGRVDRWIEEGEERRNRAASAEAAETAAESGSRLVNVAITEYCPRYVPEYEVVFVDDTGHGDRIGSEFKANVERLKLPLDLAARWPDVILNIPDTNRCWILECVETDGEVDPVRKTEMEESFANAGLQVDGFTTIYRDTVRFGQRQRQVDNIAPGTYVWIAELGGGQLLKQSASKPRDYG